MKEAALLFCSFLPRLCPAVPQCRLQGVANDSRHVFAQTPHAFLDAVKLAVSPV